MLERLGKWRIAVEWALAYVFCFALIYYFEFQTLYIPETDGYFHIKVASLIREQGLFLKGFPWAYYSIWRDGYSDGCLLYHLFLIPFTFGDLATGAKWATVTLSAFAFSSCFIIFTLNKVRFRFYWFFLLLLGGEFFWWRLLVPRPQVLSVSLLMWSIHFLLNGKRRGFVVLSFLYPLTYVAAFIPLVCAFIRAVYLKVFEGKSEFKIFYAGVAAFALAMLLHPYFPKNLLFFWVQNIWVMYFAVTQKVTLYLGMEFFPMDTRRLFFSHLPLNLHLVGTLFAIFHLRPALSEKTRVLFPFALMVIFMAFISKRFTEYAVPLTTFLCAMVFTDLMQGRTIGDFYKKFKRVAWGFTAVWVGFLGLWTYRNHLITRQDMEFLKPPRFEESAMTLRSVAPANELIYTCDWDEPPELLFFNDHHRYIVMMDPTFMYYWDPKLWQLWFNVSNVRMPPDEIYAALTEKFKARFGACSQKFSIFRQLIGKDPRYQILKETPETFTFQIL